MVILCGTVVCYDTRRSFYSALYDRRAFSNFTTATDIIEASTNFLRGISYPTLYLPVRFYRGNFHPGFILSSDLSDRTLPYQKHGTARDLYSRRSLTISLVNAIRGLSARENVRRRRERKLLLKSSRSRETCRTIGGYEINRRTHLMKSRGRMMVLPGRHRVRTYARVGAGKINGQDFAAARRRAYRVCRSV